MDFLKIYTEAIHEYITANRLPESPVSLYEPVDYLMKIGGKRIRPALVLMAYNLFKSDYEKALPAAYSLELFHNFSLMHDDIMDEATLRRGNLTVHKKYDVNTAILSGDVMLIHCYEYLSKYDDAKAIKLIRLFNKMGVELCIGQRMDMDFETSDVTIQQYLKMIEYKTAVLIACALRMGGIIADIDDEKLNYLGEFGKNIGIAFQVQDDILDSFGNEEQVGKRPGGDIMQNKKTYLYLKSMELGDDKQREILNKYYSSTKFNEDEKIPAVKEIFEKTGAKEYSLQLREVYFDLAISHMKQLNLDLEKESMLHNFAQYLVMREK